jgi:hypothetical protein
MSEEEKLRSILSAIAAGAQPKHILADDLEAAKF